MNDEKSFTMVAGILVFLTILFFIGLFWAVTIVLAIVILIIKFISKKNNENNGEPKKVVARWHYHISNNKIAISKLNKKIRRELSRENIDEDKVKALKKLLETEKMFENSQVFHRDFKIMFNDEHKVLKIQGVVIMYEDIKHFKVEEKCEYFEKTVIHQQNAVARGIVGGALFGPIGAFIGAISGEQKIQTSYHKNSKGFILVFYLKNKTQLNFYVPINPYNQSVLMKHWVSVSNKLDLITK